MNAREIWECGFKPVSGLPFHRGFDLTSFRKAARMLTDWELAQRIGMPKIVCLCGSTRFYEVFQKANFDETMAGHIVLSVGFYPGGGFESRAPHGEDVGITPAEKVKLDELHKRKIDLADEVLVLNVGGYVGNSTRSEVLHALDSGKLVRWLESDKIPLDLRY